ncbi:hypothetical protein DXA89_02450 [Weissella cibaria]|nr:hypothetical protein DXA89_02450 [Weissella cibaria]
MADAREAGQDAADLSQTTADNAAQDVADAQAKSDQNLADAQKAATDTITDNIATIADNIQNITDDIATLQDLADKNPGDTTIADKLADAQQQLTEAEAAKAAAESDLDQVADQTTLLTSLML